MHDACFHTSRHKRVNNIFRKHFTLEIISVAKRVTGNLEKMKICY
jgi:hypothetical protein